MLPALLLSLATAAQPQVRCDPLTFELPVPELEVRAPKGFAWEGPAPLAALPDGRVLLARHAALGGIPTKVLARQQKKAMVTKARADSPWRVTQLFTVDPAGQTAPGPLVDRGNPLEVVHLPGGPTVLAHRARETTVLVVFSPDEAAVTREIELPDSIRYDGKWRDRNAVKGTSVPKLFAIDASRVLHAADNLAHVVDVTTGLVSEEMPVRSNQIAVVQGADGAEIFALEEGDRLLRLGPDLTILDQRECVDCQLVPVGSAGGPPTAALLARPIDAGFRVAFLRAGDSLAALPTGIDVALPQAIVGQEISWSVRPGTPDTGLLALTGHGEDPAHFAYGFAPDRSEPVWRYQAPDVGDRGELLVADAIGAQVRLRLVLAKGGREDTSHAALLDPATGRSTDWVAVGDAPEELRTILTDIGAPARQGPHSGFVPPVDPMLDRAPHGPSRATLQRCALEPAAP